MMDIEDFVRRYLRAIETDALVGREDEWYTPDAVQIEWPNALAPDGATRDLTELRKAGERGRAIVETQRYEVTNLVTDSRAGRVAVEAVFRATYRIDLPNLPRGQVMEARFAMFFEFADGRIRRHRTYDCFMPPDAT